MIIMCIAILVSGITKTCLSTCMTLRNTLIFTTDHFHISRCLEQFISFSVDPPKVIHHPNSQTVSTGVETTFTVEATGDDLIFQWQKNGSDVHNDSNYSGTDTNTLSITHVNKSDGGRYRCLVKNEVKRDGEVSEEAKLHVCKCPSDIISCSGLSFLSVVFVSLVY